MPHSRCSVGDVVDVSGIADVVGVADVADVVGVVDVELTLDVVTTVGVRPPGSQLAIVQAHIPTRTMLLARRKTLIEREPFMSRHVAPHVLVICREMFGYRR